MRTGKLDHQVRDRFGAAAHKLIKRIERIGWKAALEEQVDKPLLPTSDWARMIVNLIRLQTEDDADLIALDDESETWKCLDCKDAGFRMRTTKTGITLSQPCGDLGVPCAYRRWRLSQTEQKLTGGKKGTILPKS